LPTVLEVVYQWHDKGMTALAIAAIWRKPHCLEQDKTLTGILGFGHGCDRQGEAAEEAGE
jgi:hypothetical protein